MDFIHFILKDFLPVSIEHNAFVSPYLGFSSAKFIGSS